MPLAEADSERKAHDRSIQNGKLGVARDHRAGADPGENGSVDLAGFKPLNKVGRIVEADELRFGIGFLEKGTENHAVDVADTPMT